MCMGRFGQTPPPPTLAWAPDMALVRKMEGEGLTFFITLIDTPCGAGQFVSHCNQVAIDGNNITIEIICEGRRHDFPVEDQQWNVGRLVYVVDENGEFIAGKLEIDETLREMPESFRTCPAEIADIAGYTEDMAAYK